MNLYKKCMARVIIALFVFNTFININFLTSLTVHGATCTCSVDSPHTISDFNGLKTIGDDLNSGKTSCFYQLTSDIDCLNEAIFPFGTELTDYEPKRTAFAGTFDGNGFTISNLKIEKVGGNLISEVGLFYRLNSGGKIMNTHMKNANISGVSLVGGLTGKVMKGATVQNCSVNSQIKGESNLGGITGINLGTIKESYSSGSVAGNSKLGGITGLNSTGTINECFSGMSILNNGSTEVGGITGNNNLGYITNCYNVGPIMGETNVGGIVGKSYISKTMGKISSCYNAANVDGYTSVGALIGYSNSTLDNCYYDRQVSGKDGTGIAYTTYTMTNGVLPTGFESDKWIFNSGTYPELKVISESSDLLHQSNSKLSIIPINLDSSETSIIIRSDFTAPLMIDGKKLVWNSSSDGSITYTEGQNIANFTVSQSSSGSTCEIRLTGFEGENSTFIKKFKFNSTYKNPFLIGSGTVNDPYIINAPNELNDIRNDLNRHFKLGQNIDLTDFVTWDENGQGGFMPIGSSQNPFTGSLDGDIYTIINLAIVRPSRNEVGFFGATGPTSVIKNLGFVNASVEGYENVGVLAGVHNGTAMDSYVRGSVKGVVNVGGMFGKTCSDSKIMRCYTAVVPKEFTSTNRGAFIGNRMDNSIVMNSVYDYTTYGIITGSDNNCGVGYGVHSGFTSKSSIQMKSRNEYDASWQMGTKWEVDPALNGGYPVLITPATDMELNHSEITKKVGATLYLSASIFPENATVKSASFVSSNPTVAKVEKLNSTMNTAEILLRSEGTATITVTSNNGGFIKKCIVTVGQPFFPSANIITGGYKLDTYTNKDVDIKLTVPQPEYDEIYEVTYEGENRVETKLTDFIFKYTQTGVHQKTIVAKNSITNEYSKDTLLKIKIDKVAPVINSVSFNDSLTNQSSTISSNGLKPVVVATDEGGSELKQTLYALTTESTPPADSSAWKTLGLNTVLNSNFKGNFFVKAIDNAGNETISSPYAILIDTTEPTLTVKTSAKDITKWSYEPIEFTINSSDDISLISKVEFYENDDLDTIQVVSVSSVLNNEYKFTYSTNGENKITIRSTNESGLIAEESVNCKIDKNLKSFIDKYISLKAIIDAGDETTYKNNIIAITELINMANSLTNEQKAKIDLSVFEDISNYQKKSIEPVIGSSDSNVNLTESNLLSKVKLPIYDFADLKSVSIALDVAKISKTHNVVPPQPSYVLMANLLKNAYSEKNILYYYDFDLNLKTVYNDESNNKTLPINIINDIEVAVNLSSSDISSEGLLALIATLDENGEIVFSPRNITIETVSNKSMGKFKMSNSIGVLIVSDIKAPTPKPDPPPSNKPSTGNSGSIVVDPFPTENLNKHYSYISGYEDGSFNPDGAITRAEVATIIYNIFGNKTIAYSSSFADVDKNSWAYQAISFLYESGYVVGYKDNMFKPTDFITRAEFATIISKVYKIAPINDVELKFKDLDREHWAYGYLAGLLDRGIIKGYYGSLMSPDNNIARAECVTMINRSENRIVSPTHMDNKQGFTDVTTQHWAYYEILEASCEHRYSISPNGTEVWYYE